MRRGRQVTTVLRRVTGAARRRWPPHGPGRAPPEPEVQVLVERAGEPARGYLHRAYRAGHPVATLDRFARQLRGLPAAQLRLRLRLVDPARPGPVRVPAARPGGGAPLAQIDSTTCGPMTVMVARALADPVYAWWLTGADAADRIASEQRRIHRQANRVWPRRLGTTPWGVAAVLNHHLPGTRYRWRMVDDTDPASVGTALSAALAAVAAGHPVPVLVGARIPRHWVLLLARDPGGELVFYNPAGGTVVRLDPAEIGTGPLAGLGYPHLQAVVAVPAVVRSC